jgi:hypothetical protein
VDHWGLLRRGKWFARGSYFLQGTEDLEIKILAINFD